MSALNQPIAKHECEQNIPLFTLSVSFTGSQFIVDTNQLNVLVSAACGDEEDSQIQNLLKEMQDKLQDTYAQVTPLLESLLCAVFGAESISKGEMRSVSESTLFFIGGEENED